MRHRSDFDRQNQAHARKDIDGVCRRRCHPRRGGAVSAAR